MTRAERVQRALALAPGGAPARSLPVVGPKESASPAAGLCRRLGGPDGGTVSCPTCAGRVELKTFACARHKRCTIAKRVDGTACCAGCPDRALPNAARPAWDRLAPLKLDRADLFAELPGYRFNPSVIARGDGYVLCWRDGWAGSDLWCCRLDAGFRTVGEPVHLMLRHWAAGYGREDPQLFEYAGRLCVAFVGVQGVSGRVARTNVLFAVLDNDTLEVRHVYAPRAPGVEPGRWEKNWGFFEADGALYAVYQIAPHRVLRVRGNDAEWVAQEENPLPWAGGERRGGAPPVRAGDELWTFFHDRVDRPGARPLYRVGLIANAAEFPFRPTRQIPTPLAAADPATNPGNYCDCLFPRGAVRVGPDWAVACGVHDRWSELHAFSHADLDRRLVGVT